MDNKIPTISYAAHEGMMARMERTIRRLWILCIILILLLAGTNAAWIYYENSFEDVVITAEQSAETGNNYAVGGDVYGEAEGDN